MEQEQERRRQEQRRIDATAKACREVLTDGWQRTVAARIANHVTESTRHALYKQRLNKTCRRLAKLAANVLRGKQRLHEGVGSTARRLTSMFGGRRLEQAFAAELASNLPLPFDEQAVAVARGLQMTGVLLCVANGRDLTRCQCFIDLSLTEAKERVAAVLTAGLQDWTRLAAFSPAAAR